MRDVSEKQLQVLLDALAVIRMLSQAQPYDALAYHLDAIEEVVAKAAAQEIP